MSDLTLDILTLIESKSEGQYWDFKRESHSNNGNLLHDIVCLANANHSGDRYLIIGVSDPSDGCQIYGLNASTEHRKNQSVLIDFLRSKPFAGHQRPSVLIETIVIDEKEVDVIIMKNVPYKPFYLTSNYQSVKAHHIYSRVGDTNTPIDSSADVPEIELMWKERFKLIPDSVEKMETLLLEPENWVIDVGNKDYAYHKQFPEFNIQFLETREFQEVYCYYFHNHKSFFGEVHFKYQNTILFEYHYVFLDEMRIVVSLPEVRNPRYESNDMLFYF